MGKCLITRLQEVVDNDNLKKLGELELVASGVDSGNVGWINVTDDIGGHVSVVGGTAYTDESRGTALGSEFDITSTPFKIVVSDGDSIVKMTSVYGITWISFGNSIKLRIDDLAYAKEGVSVRYYHSALPENPPFVGNIDSISNRNAGSIILRKVSNDAGLSLKGVNGSVGNIDKFAIDYGSSASKFQVSLRDSGIVGDVSAFGGFNSNLKTNITSITTNATNVGKISGNIEGFKDYVNIDVFDLNYVPLTGSIATALGRMTKLTSIAIGGHTQAEDLKNLFDALHANGKTSGSIQVWAGSNKTLNGNTWTNGSTVTFTASGWTVA